MVHASVPCNGFYNLDRKGDEYCCSAPWQLHVQGEKARIVSHSPTLTLNVSVISPVSFLQEQEREHAK